MAKLRLGRLPLLSLRSETSWLWSVGTRNNGKGASEAEEEEVIVLATPENQPAASRAPPRLAGEGQGQTEEEVDRGVQGRAFGRLTVAWVLAGRIG